jgi:hypothetical protein
MFALTRRELGFSRRPLHVTAKAKPHQKSWSSPSGKSKNDESNGSTAMESDISFEVVPARWSMPEGPLACSDDEPECGRSAAAIGGRWNIEVAPVLHPWRR